MPLLKQRSYRKVDADPPTDVTLAGFWYLGTYSSPTHYTHTNGFIYDAFGSNTIKISPNPAQNLAAYHAYSVYSRTNDWASYLNGGLLYSTTTNTVAFRSDPLIGASAGVHLFANMRRFILFNRKLTSNERHTAITGARSYYNLQ